MHIHARFVTQRLQSLWAEAPSIYFVLFNNFQGFLFVSLLSQLSKYLINPEPLCRKWLIWTMCRPNTLLNNTTMFVNISFSFSVGSVSTRLPLSFELAQNFNWWNLVMFHFVFYPRKSTKIYAAIVWHSDIGFEMVEREFKLG